MTTEEFTQNALLQFNLPFGHDHYKRAGDEKSGQISERQRACCQKQGKAEIHWIAGVSVEPAGNQSRCGL